MKIFSIMARCLNNELLPPETKDMNPLERQQQLQEEQKQDYDSLSDKRMSIQGSDSQGSDSLPELQVNLEDLQDEAEDSEEEEEVEYQL